MSGLISIIAGIALIIYAVQHDKKSKENKWLKDWGFWIITVLIIVAGIFSLNDSSPSGIFTVVMMLVLLLLLFWRFTDRRKKNLKGKQKALHILVTILFVIIWFCIFGPISGSLQSNEENHVVNHIQKTSIAKYINLDGQKIYYKKSKKYKVNGKANSSWAGAEAKVNSVTVYKIKKGYAYGSKRNKKAVQGIVALNVKVKAIKDIRVLMDSATISISSINEEHDVETKDDWDELDKGISKTGTVYIPIYKLSKIGDIKSLRFKFGCQLQNTNELDNYNHIYDMTIKL